MATATSGPCPKSRELWAGVATGTLKVERFGLNGAWVPWYNLHKLFAGLRDAHLIGGNAQAREVLVALARLVRHARRRSCRTIRCSRCSAPSTAA